MTEPRHLELDLDTGPRSLLVRYADAVDAGDWDAFEALFATDAIAEYSKLGRFEGAPSIASAVRTRVEQLQGGLHFITNERLCLIDGVMTLTANVWQARSWPDGGWNMEAGRYTVELVEAHGVWVINHLVHESRWLLGSARDV